jgi:hypothetical protein
MLIILKRSVFLKKLTAITITTFLAVMAMFIAPPIAQDPSYHSFADHRDLLGIHNLLNVASNLPFFLVAVLGFYQTSILFRKNRNSQPDHWKSLMYLVFFFGVFLTGLGSSYYHLEPNTQTLIWDRLPMTIAFMAFFTLIIHDHANARAAKNLLLPLLAIGIYSVIYWAYTESTGKGDLRLYALVQFLPLILVPIMIFKSKNRGLEARSVWIVIGYYAAAKVFEHWDSQIFGLLGNDLSGHSIKHVLAALGTYTVYRSLGKENTAGNIQRESVDS